MSKDKNPKVARYPARTEKLVKGDRSLRLRLTKRSGNGLFVITSRLKKGDTTTKGKAETFRTEAEAETGLLTLLSQAAEKGWTRQESKTRFDYQGIPD